MLDIIIIIILEQHDIRTYIPPMLDYLSDGGESSTTIIHHHHEDIGDNVGTLNGSPPIEGFATSDSPFQLVGRDAYVQYGTAAPIIT